jgi:hypothetical protein
VLTPNINFPIQKLNYMLRSYTAGPFIGNLMGSMLTSDEMRSYSKTGGTCAANQKRNVAAKTGIPIDMTNAIVGML